MNVDWNGWKFYTKDHIPQQENGVDCGVFLLQVITYQLLLRYYAEIMLMFSFQYMRCLLLEEPMNFNQVS